MADPPGTQWLRRQPQRTQNAPPMVNMPGPVWHKYGPHMHDWRQYEDTVDNFIAERGLKKGDRFHVHHHGRVDPTVYEYLGPNSGGRKDWVWAGRKYERR